MRKIILLALILGALFATSMKSVAFADDGSPTSEPTVPQTEILANGDVVVDAGTPRNADYAIGDSIPVIVVFELKHNTQGPAKSLPFDQNSYLTNSATAPSAPPTTPLAVPEISVAGLNMGVLSNAPSDVELMKVPIAEQTYTDGQKDYLRVEFWVRQFVTCQKDASGNPKRQVSISADFEYAVDASPDGQPDWQTASTPPILVDIVPTAGDDQTILREGDLVLKESPHSPLILVLIVLGLPLMLPLIYESGSLAYSRCKRSSRLSANQIFWQQVDPVIAQAEEAGKFDRVDYQKILYELRQRYQVSMLHIDALLKALENEPHYPAIERVFSMERNIYKKETISQEQHEQFIASLILLVPRE